MGRHKKAVEEEKKETPKEPEKIEAPKKVKKWRCSIGAQSKDFDTQEEARNMAIEILQTRKVFFLELKGVEVDDY